MVDGLGEYRDIHSLCWEKGLVSLKIVYNFTLRLFTVGGVIFNRILANEARALASCELRGNPNCNPFTWNHFKKDCCTFTQPCGIGEGECQHDRECRANLVCGKNNCYHILGFPNNTNCCKPPGANDPGTLFPTHETISSIGKLKMQNH